MFHFFATTLSIFQWSVTQTRDSWGTKCSEKMMRTNENKQYVNPNNNCAKTRHLPGYVMISRKEKHNGYCCVHERTLNARESSKKYLGFVAAEGTQKLSRYVMHWRKVKSSLPMSSKQARQKRLMETAPRERHEPSRERQVLFPTCQVRVVRFYVSSVLLLLFLLLLLVFLVPNCDDVCSVFPAGPQPRSGEFSVPCWISTAIM